MAYEIGIFHTEQQAINAVQALEAEGFSNHAIKVFAKDREHSHRVEAETDVHADELNEITAARDQAGEDGDGLIGIVGPGAGVVAGTYLAGTPSAVGAAPYYGAPAIGGSAVFGDDDSPMESALRDLGITGDAATTCRDAIAEGAIIVAADIGNASGNDGPNLTAAGSAEAVFRRIGASAVL
ncbi:uncharacterized protein YoaH (UPF0181 family) [Paenibacillus phyllosphaerae]|uniref:Uncharacterized protein YoaH (UPF0181 family) n=1 Tax=Paenibacillus phyllosphaerae TaxID=274593 RepID=A0A7W5B1B3_9BACL|nr:general stress protein [Paenibacillus phyllosphaerae]MBB3112066.1 uncharacterized protein YoaH (UPF0181 family) [Paenibacillus phyllosphaerae]